MKGPQTMWLACQAQRAQLGREGEGGGGAGAARQALWAWGVTLFRAPSGAPLEVKHMPNQMFT
jgi:hypothetical protein